MYLKSYVKSIFCIHTYILAHIRSFSDHFRRSCRAQFSLWKDWAHLLFVISQRSHLQVRSIFTFWDEEGVLDRRVKVNVSLYLLPMRESSYTTEHNSRYLTLTKAVNSRKPHIHPSSSRHLISSHSSALTPTPW